MQLVSLQRVLRDALMVIVRLYGGLGNQLFQYAFAKRLALTLNAELRLDLTAFAKQNGMRSPRVFELAPFCIEDAVASADDLARFRVGEKRYSLGWVAHQYFGWRPRGYIREAHYHFDPAMLSLPDGVYLDGYWQSERYFKDQEQAVRDRIRVSGSPSGQNKALLDEISTRNAISLHVRRGDYLLDQAVYDLHGLCSLQYYHDAVEFLSERIDQPEFYIFSDEPEWARENIKLEFPVYVVDVNGPDACYEDLRLMSGCRHHIIANSSFSWWGAWLNPRKDRIVIAPRRWFNKSDADTRDICPDEWVRM